MAHPIAPSFVRANVAAMDGYTPGEQPSVGERVVKLNTNENPFPPSPRVLAAIRDLPAEALRRYPDPDANVLRDAAARRHSLTRDHVLAGNGSDDLLTIAIRTFVGPSGVLAYPDPTYSLYPVLARIEDARATPVPWEPGFALPTAALLATKPAAIFLANPNAPSGTLVPPAEVAALAEAFAGLLLVDEAYADFAETDCVSLVDKHPNVVITRSMSKAFSLAGLRVGYALAHREVIREMQKVKDSYNVDAIAAVAGAAALDDIEHARASWEHVKSERARLSAELGKLGFDVLPSQANFVLATVPGGNGKQAYTRLKQQGILVRHFDKPGLADKIRITVGTSNENNAILAGLKQILAAEKAA